MFVFKAVPLLAECRPLTLLPKGSTFLATLKSQLSLTTFFSCPEVVPYLKTTLFCPRDI